MPVRTQHQFIDLYPVRTTDRRLTLGTIHPHNVSDFRFPYYYGNVGSFWDFIGKSFPNKDFSNLENIIYNVLEKNIWISDIIYECERENERVTEDKKLYNIKLNTKKIKDVIVNSQINHIIFTSAFGKNNRAKLLPKLLV